MPWFYNITKNEEGARPVGCGPHDDEDWAQQCRDASELDDTVTVGEVFEAPANHLRDREAYPVVVAHIVHGDGLEYAHWSDGSEEPLE